MAEDLFPRERVTLMLRRLPAYLRLAWRLAKDPLLSRARRAAVVGAAGYLASPIDLVPGVIPVAGQLDDLAVALAAIRLALAGLSPERRREHLEAVGLGDQDLADDLRTLGATTAWLARAGFRASKRVTLAGGRAAAAGAGMALRLTRTVAGRSGPALRSAVSGAAPAARELGTKVVPATRATGRATRDAAASVAGAGAGALGAGVDAFGKGVRRIGPRRPGAGDPSASPDPSNGEPEERTRG
jgi:uncharacterized membrane protein YkvA (DUF1232 family)